MSQKKEDFIESVENALHFFGGVPQAIVPDNLKSAVTKSHRYEPTLNETFLDFAEHYGTTILPARAYRPRDKSLVEGAVKILYTRIYSVLKDQQFFSLKALNSAIKTLLEKHNSSNLTGKPYSRKQLFDELEKAELKELVTQYGPIEFFWMDHAVGDGGLSRKETVEFIHQFQPNCFIGNNVFVGNNCTIHSNVSIYDGTIIGNNVIIHANTVLGASAFYYKKRGETLLFHWWGDLWGSNPRPSEPQSDALTN